MFWSNTANVFYTNLTADKTFLKLLWVDPVSIEHTYIRFSHEEPLIFAFPFDIWNPFGNLFNFRAFSSRKLRWILIFFSSTWAISGVFLSGFWIFCDLVQYFGCFGEEKFWVFRNFGIEYLPIVFRVQILMRKYLVGRWRFACICWKLGYYRCFLEGNRIGLVPNRESLKLLCGFCVMKVF